jgi:hypothetical protein
VNFVGVHIPRLGLHMGTCVGIVGEAMEIVRILRKLVGKIDEKGLEMLDGVSSFFTEFGDRLLGFLWILLKSIAQISIYFAETLFAVRKCFR